MRMAIFKKPPQRSPSFELLCAGFYARLIEDQQGFKLQHALTRAFEDRLPSLQGQSDDSRHRAQSFQENLCHDLPVYDGPNGTWSTHP